jgi:hypothetical protein
VTDAWRAVALELRLHPRSVALEALVLRDERTAGTELPLRKQIDPAATRPALV